MIFIQKARRAGKTHAIQEQLLTDKDIPQAIKAQVQFERLNRLKSSILYRA